MVCAKLFSSHLEFPDVILDHLHDAAEKIDEIKNRCTLSGLSDAVKSGYISISDLSVYRMENQLNKKQQKRFDDLTEKFESSLQRIEVECICKKSKVKWTEEDREKFKYYSTH